MALSDIFSLFPALMIVFACLLCLFRNIDVYAVMTRGAIKGLQTVRSVLPALVCLFPAIAFMRAAGVPEILGRLLRPLFSLLGIPDELSLLMLVRPLSGSAAMSVASELMQSFGADSRIGRTAAVMLGSSETTFYVIAVYFSAAGVKNSRWAIPAALAADFVCFLSSAWLCRLFWGT